MGKEIIHFQVGIEIEGNDATVALVAQVIRYWLASDNESALDAILDCLCDAPFAYFPATIQPPTNWHFGEGRIELDASPLSAWQASVN